jgi:hypothetical protein
MRSRAPSATARLRPRPAATPVAACAVTRPTARPRFHATAASVVTKPST